MNIEIHQNELQERVIRQLFKHGYPYKTILYILQHNHGIHISERTLYNRLRTFRLGRRNNLNDVNFRHVQDLIGNRLDGPDSLLGYRLLWNKLRSEDNVQVPRDVVMFLLQHMDPDGVQRRKSHRLNRRTYFSLGPNYCWHIDGYDKLKPFGFPIHGCTDGFSRKVLWLQLLPSNNDPSVIANCYLQSLSESIPGQVPRKIRSDCGTENVLVCAMQCYMRRNHPDNCSGDRAFIYGTSHSNQRQESWWSFYRRSSSSWIIDFFKKLIDDDQYHPNDSLELACAQFVFGPLIQKNLDDTATLWNNHYIRRSKHSQINGRPNELYYLPEMHGFSDQAFAIDNHEDLQEMKEYLSAQNDQHENIYRSYFVYLTQQLRILQPSDWQNAKEFYFFLLSFAR